MILDRLEQAEQYVAMNKHFSKAFSFLRQNNLKGLAPGRHEIDGDGVYAIVVKGQGSGHEKAKLEIHQKYIDIQYVLEGCDEMGWKNLSRCTLSQGPYDSDTDAEMFVDTPDTWLKVGAGSLAVFFPEDAHAPGAGDGEFHKVVAKIRVD